MYLNTFIGLEENVTGYGARQKRPSGHVTITTPGIVKCYVQDLRPLATKEYILYALGKDKKAVRLGKLNDPSQNKQTIWNIDIENVNAQNISAKDIDCVAILIEGEDIGSTDTIMMGYAKDKYLITSLLEPSLPRKITPKPETKMTAKVEPVISKTEASSMLHQPAPKPVAVPQTVSEVMPEVQSVANRNQAIAPEPKKESGIEICAKDIEELKLSLSKQLKFIVDDQEREANTKREDEHNAVNNAEDTLAKQLQSLMAEPKKQGSKDLGSVLEEFIRAQEISETASDGVSLEEVAVTNTFAATEENDYLEDLEEKLKKLQMTLEKQDEPVETMSEDNSPSFYECEACKKKQEPFLKDNKFSRAKEIFEDSTPATPFKMRSEPISWVMMSTAELMSLPQFSYEWCTQPFITYCYHKFNHLILGKDNDIEQYYIGIPDIYHSTRKYILELDKVESFKCVENKSPSAGDYGYWIVRV